MNNGARILVVRLSSMGDLFHALPAVRMLGAGLGATVDWVTQEEYADLVRCFADVDRVIAFRRRGGSVGSIADLVGSLREHRYDMVVDFQGLLKSAGVAWLARAPRRIGPSYHREFARVFYTDIAGRRNKDRHAVDENLDVVGYLGLRRLAVEFPLRFPDAMPVGQSPRVAVLPVSRWSSKNWPAGRFASVCRTLCAHTRCTCFAVGAASDREVCDEIAGPLGAAGHNMAGRLSLPELGGLLSKMDLLISVDSGPMHMAAALGVPVLALFGPTDPRRTGPYGTNNRVLTAAGVSCAPCFKRECDVGSRACMDAIGEAEVAQAAEEMLSAGR